MIQVGDVVVPNQRPEGFDRWLVVEVEGLLLTLQSDFPVMIRRLAKDVRRVEE